MPHHPSPLFHCHQRHQGRGATVAWSRKVSFNQFRYDSNKTISKGNSLNDYWWGNASPLTFILARLTAKPYQFVDGNGGLLDLVNPRPVVPMPVMLLGAPMLCPLPVVPECHRSCLYASPRAGLRALMRLPKVLVLIHSTLPLLAQENTQECC